MGNRRKLNGRILLSLVLVVGAALLFLWPICPREPKPESVSESSAALPVEAPQVALPAPEETPVPTDPNAAKIRISELMVKNRATLPDEDGDFPDWIELENISGDTVDLSGWLLRDGGDKDGWRFPQTLLGPGERLLIFASGKDRPGHAGFSLSAGETLQLYTANGCPVEELICPDGEADRSWLPDGEGGWSACIYPTPGRPNTVADYDVLMAARETPGPLVINEVCVYNRSGRWTAQVGISDWLELKNVSDQPLDLSDYYVSDQVDNRMLYRLPVKVLQPGEFFLLMCNKEESLLGAALLCREFSLSSDTDRVYLSRYDGSLADYVSLRGIPAEASYGRLPGQNGWFYLPEPSPGAENDHGARRVSRQPRSLSPDGIYNGVESVSVSLEGGGLIRYTTDGSYPDETSKVYEGPISLRETGIVRAVCWEEGALPSRALTLSYILNEYHSLPVVSLVSDDKGLERIYGGSIKDVEVPASLSFYEEEGSFTIPCGVKMHGETSLSLPKKNMSLRFRGVYGQRELHYDLFRDGGVSDFTNLLLRGGQDYYHSIIRNELCTELARSVTDRVVVSRNRYCILYLDGWYVGIYALGEKLNEAMYAHQMGVSRDSVTVVTAPLAWNDSFNLEVFDYALNNDLSYPDKYREICTRLDVDSLIDWILLEGCFANDDLTYGNVRFCRTLEGADTRWKLMFYDLDSTFNHADNCFANVLSPWAFQTRQTPMLIEALLRSPAFRESLMKRASELIPQLSNQRILEEIDGLAWEIDPEVERDYSNNKLYKDNWRWNVDWLKKSITESDWNAACIRLFSEYLDMSQEEMAAYFPG